MSAHLFNLTNKIPFRLKSSLEMRLFLLFFSMEFQLSTDDARYD